MSDPRRLDDFLGSWHITRQIMHSGAPEAQFVGQGVWTPSPDGAIYEERGTLTMPGAQPMQAERRYVWHGLDVYFDDGRFFHAVPPMGGDTQHWCDPDTYRVHYAFDQWPAFTVSWQVTGPRKDYTMRSTYTQA